MAAYPADEGGIGVALLAGSFALIAVGGLLITACESPLSAACNPGGFGLQAVGLVLVPVGLSVLAAGILALARVTNRYLWVSEGFRASCPVGGSPSDGAGSWADGMAPPAGNADEVTTCALPSRALPSRASGPE